MAATDDIDNEESCLSIQIQHEKKAIAAALHRPKGSALGVAVILTHGAGGDMDLPQLVALANHLSENGFTCLRFTCKGLNIKYRTNVYKTVLEYVYNQRTELGVESAVLAGRSMGSRAAAGTANQSLSTTLGKFILGVVCLAYPLHPPKDPSNLRDALLRQMNHPCLIVNGTEDKMCQRHLMDSIVDSRDEASIPAQVRIHWVAGADHSHKVKGRSGDEVSSEIFEAVLSFCKDILPSDTDMDTGSAGKMKRKTNKCSDVTRKGTKRKR